MAAVDTSGVEWPVDFDLVLGKGLDADVAKGFGELRGGVVSDTPPITDFHGRPASYIASCSRPHPMWLEMIVDGAVVTFSQVGMYLDRFGKDPRCEWASRIEAEAQKTCGNKG